mmetsp:Transcript_12479/g.37107  ORF Transcript_12479/g.37107 Transcript_12479/m.37107 type:complete len:161 (+) Transcript_12479:221-703(+)
MEQTAAREQNISAGDAPPRGGVVEACGQSNLQRFLAKYGVLAIIVYGTISLGTFITVCLFLLMGADARPLLKRFGFSKAESTASLFLVAVAVTKILVPVKLPVAACIVVRIARKRGPASPVPFSIGATRETRVELQNLLSEDLDEDGDASEYRDIEDAPR